MVNHKRRKRLLGVLSEHAAATVPQLVAWLSASPATVRRDIHWLAERGLLTRTRGGAARLAGDRHPPTLAGASFDQNLQQFAERKRAIARYAGTLCADGDTIMIHSGSTTSMMAEFLVHKHLTVITNSLSMAHSLLASADHEIVLAGGTVYRAQNLILNRFDDDLPRHHYAAKMFMSVHGLSPLGLLEADPLLVKAEQRLIGQAEELIVLADSSKFARTGGLLLCGLDRVATVITDTGASDAAVQLLERAGVTVVTVAPAENASPASPPRPAPAAAPRPPERRREARPC